MTTPCEHVFKFVGNRKKDELVQGPLSSYWATVLKGYYRCGACGAGQFRDAVLDDFQHELLDK